VPAGGGAPRLVWSRPAEELPGQSDESSSPVDAVTASPPAPAPVPDPAAPLRPPPAAVVPHRRPAPALAPHARPLPHPRLRGHAAADAGRPRRAEVPRVPAPLPLPRGAGARPRRRGARGLVPAGLQRPPRAALADRPHRAGGARRPPPRGARPAPAPARHRPLHRRGAALFRLRPPRGPARHERPPRPAARLLRPPGVRPGAVGAGRAAPAAAGLRLQPGPDGLRRADLHRPTPAVRPLPPHRPLPHLPAPGIGGARAGRARPCR